MSLPARYQLLCVGAAPADGDTAWGEFEPMPCLSLDAAAEALRTQHFDAALFAFDSDAQAERIAVWPALSQAVLDAGVVVVTPHPSAALAARLLQNGVQDVLSIGEAQGEALTRALRLAIERKAIDRSARKAHATDLATGLPNHAQLMEHMTHILALREREPAPMALLAFRIEGLATTEARLGSESANILRRKVAVRLRAGLRASDVVASIGADSFAVLLAWIDAPEDGDRVASKLVQSLQRPFSVTGQNVPIAVSAGVALYPDQGKDADSLMRRAVGQAAGAVSTGGGGFANMVERGPAVAANDEEPPTD